MDNKPAQENTHYLRQIIAVFGILLVLIGQIFLYVTPVTEDAIPSTVWLSIAGVVIFMVSFLIKTSPGTKNWAGQFSFGKTSSWVIAAVILSIVTTIAMLLFQNSTRMNYLPVLITWIASGMCFIIAFRNDLFPKTDWKIWLAKYRTELIWVISITILAFILRFVQLGQYPRVVDGDEGLLGLAAISTDNTYLANPFALWENFGSLYLLLVNAAFEIFGASAFSLRLLPAISGVLAIPVLYLLARKIAGKRVAFISSFLLMCSHTHIHFSRIGSVGYIHATWLVPLELYLLFSGLDKRSAWRTAAAGVLLAIHFSVYLTSQVVVALVLVFMVIAFIFLKKWFRPALKQAGIFWAGFLIMLQPELSYILENPNQFFDRLSQNGTFQSGWFQETMASTGQSAIMVLLGRIEHSFMSLVYFPAIDFYGSSVSMLSLFAAMFFMIGIGLILFKLRSPGILLLNGYFWAFTVAVGVFSIPPSADSYRMLIVLPAAMIIIAIAIDKVWEILGIQWQKDKKVYGFVTGAFLLSLLVLNIWTYYVDFLGNCLYGESERGRFASYLGRFVAASNQDVTIFLLSDNEYYYGTHASTDFLDDTHPITNFPDSLDAFPGHSGDVIISTPDRQSELEDWIHLYPGGEYTVQYDCENPLLTAYIVP